MVVAEGRGRRERESVIDGHRVPGWGDKRASDGYTTTCVNLMPPNRLLKNGENGQCRCNVYFTKLF